MSVNKPYIRGTLERFASDQGGGTAVQITLAFAAFAIVFGMAAAPFLQQTLQYEARSGFAVDRMTTGSVNSSNRYTIRRSVLAEPGDVVCIGSPCPSRQ
jgi:hypothetical protein